MKKGTMIQDQHEFALYFSSLTDCLQSSNDKKVIILQDVEICHRLVKVLRLVAGDNFILFDHFHHVTCILQKVEKKNRVVVTVINIEKNRKLTPTIHFLLPLLKRDALHDAIYTLTELGANAIHLVVTDKSQKRWPSRGYEKLMRIIYAAAEQSKNFAFPLLKEPQPLKQVLEGIDTFENRMFFFDPDGQPISQVISRVRDEEKKFPIVLMIGPEGDLSIQEKELVYKKGFIFTSLTPTILRARQAVVVSLGIFRSFLSK